MQPRRVTLSSILNSWVGEDVQLRVQGSRILIIDNKQLKNRKLDSLVSHGVGLFGKLAQGNIYGHCRQPQKENSPNLNIYQS